MSGDEIEATPRYSLNAIDRIAEHSKAPLEDAGVDIISITAEFEAILSYSASFIFLSTVDYVCLVAVISLTKLFGMV